MKYSSRFFLWAPFCLFVTLALGVAIHWWFAAEAFSRRLDALNGHEAIPGVTIGFSSKTISGFPFRLDAELTDFRVKGMAAHGAFSWTSEKFALHSLTYGRTQDIFEAAGNQILIWTDARHRLAFLPGSLRASAIADEKGLSRFDLDVINAGGKDKDGSSFTIGRAQLHLRRDPKGDALDLMASADEIKDAGGIAPIFGDHIRVLRLYITLRRGTAFTPLLAGKKSWPEAAQDWQRAGGSVAVGPVEVSSAGLSVKTEAFDIEGNLGALLSPLY